MDKLISNQDWVFINSPPNSPLRDVIPANPLSVDLFTSYRGIESSDLRANKTSPRLTGLQELKSIARSLESYKPLNESSRPLVQPKVDSFQPKVDSFQPKVDAFQPNRPSGEKIEPAVLNEVKKASSPAIPNSDVGEYPKTTLNQSPRETLISVSEWLRERYSALHVEQQLTERYEYVISQKDAEIKRLLTVIQVGKMWSSERIRVLEQTLHHQQVSNRHTELQNSQLHQYSLNSKKEYLKFMEVVESKGQVVTELELLVLEKDKEILAHKLQWERVYEHQKQEIQNLKTQLSKIKKDDHNINE